MAKSTNHTAHNQSYKNHRNGIDNPYAQLRKDLGFAFCRAESERNPLVAGPSLGVDIGSLHARLRQRVVHRSNKGHRYLELLQWALDP